MSAVSVSKVPNGSIIGMLDGVVTVVDSTVGTDEVVLFVSIGKLKRHPVRYRPDAEVEVYNMPENLRPWFGV